MSHLENGINSLVSCFSGWGCKARNFSVARTQTQACKPPSWSHTNGLQWLQCSCPAFSPTPLRADFSPVSPLHYKVLSGWQCFGKDKGPGDHLACGAMQHGQWDSGPANMHGEDPRASWRGGCLVGGSVPHTAPDLHPASTRWEDSPGNHPEATRQFSRQWQPPC